MMPKLGNPVHFTGTSRGRSNRLATYAPTRRYLSIKVSAKELQVDLQRVIVGRCENHGPLGEPYIILLLIGHPIVGEPKKALVLTTTHISLRLMIKRLHYLKDLKLWELWYMPYYG